MEYAAPFSIARKENGILDGNQSATNESYNTVAYSQQRLSQARKVLLYSTSDVYVLLFKVPIENKLRSFQFKLLHDIIPTNQRLWKMNIKLPLNARPVTFLLKLPIISFMSVLPGNVFEVMS